MATKKKVKVTAKSANMLDTKGRVTNVKAKKVSVKAPVAKAAPTPKATPTPKAAPAPRQTDAYGRLTNNSTPVWEQPNGRQPGLMQRIQPVGPAVPWQPQPPQQGGQFGYRQPGWAGIPEQQQQAAPWEATQNAEYQRRLGQGGVQNGQYMWTQPIANQDAASQAESQRRQNQDWMRPAGDYNGAPEYKPPKLTNVKTQYKTPKW